MRKWMTTFAAVALLFCARTAYSGDISGIAHIVDGDTIALGEVKIRLEGIDAPESDQICLDAQAARWACGVEAGNRLSAHIAGRSIDCTPTGQDAYHRLLAVCHLGDRRLERMDG